MLVAEVYPIKRLPRRFSVFDYSVPVGLKLERGFFVNIPFRNQTVVGVVKRVQERFSPRPDLKEIFGRLNLPKLSESELKIFEWLAKDLVQSVSALLNAAIPIQPKRTIVTPKIIPKTLKIRSTEAPAIQRAVQIMDLCNRAFISAPDLPRMAALAAAYLHSHPNDRAAIIVPGVRETEALAPFFFDFGLSVITGEKTEGRCFTAWETFKRGQTRVLLGTRLAALLLPDTVDAIFVFRSGHESLKSWDRNPRYDAREIVLKFQEQNNSRLFFLDTLPRADDLAIFTEEKIFIEHPEPRPIFINLNEERPMSPHPLISWTLDGAIQACLKNQRRVLCLYNRKGQAQSLRCTDCGFGFPCPDCRGFFTVYETTVRCHRCGRTEPRHLSCPKCAGIKLIERGFGNQNIKAALEKQFPGISVSLIDKNEQGDGKSQIILATTYYFESCRDFFVKENFGLIVDLDADVPLMIPGFRAFENTLRSIEDLRGLSLRENAVFLVQTRNPEIFLPYYSDPKTCLSEELERRRSYQVPPFVRWFRLKIRAAEARRSELELQAAIENLKNLAEVTIFPVEYEKGLGRSLSFTATPAAINTVLEKLAAVPDNIVIDTNAIS